MASTLAPLPSPATPGADNLSFASNGFTAEARAEEATAKSVTNTLRNNNSGSGGDDSRLDGHPRFIPTSPYPDHLLDLATLDPQTRLLARALAVFDKTRDDYATAPYQASFNFPAVIAELRRLAAQAPEAPEVAPTAPTAQQRWTRADYFVVAFRSQVPPTTDYADLSSLDRASHREANDSGGLLRYWFADPDADGRNLATCLWRSPADARAAGRGTVHRSASSAVRSLYREWRIERYRLVIDDGIESWKVIDWVD
ncbi:hypothetical protein SPI_02357 [Niveomyces insectorum RCEF 264]|uniref:Uncharacterized protein n=1 Tax=Niveomyces insectorum RCEF 264 TaxID=1081102 RepID=A0A162MR61_9HYPO|nr:hypothetical protein SPI_02357 [Niveomyces insectorum RCEF 264]